MNKKALLAVLFSICFIFGLNHWFGYTDSQVTEAATTTMSIPGKVTATTLNVRKTASIKGTQLTVDGTKVALKNGTAVKILKQKVVDSQKWYYVSFSYNGATKKGYVLSDYITLKFTNNISAVVYSSKVKIRKAAGTSKSYLKVNGTTVSLKKSTAVTITRETTDSTGIKWFKISFTYKNTSYVGYIQALDAKLTGIAYKVGKVTATSLNVRKTAGMDGARVTYESKAVALKKGEKVTILSSKIVDDVTWYKVRFDFSDTQLTGYVSGQYVEITEESTAGTNTSGTASETPSTSEKPSTSETPSASETPSTSEKPSASPDSNTATPIPDSEFASYLKKQGFPDSYKDALTALHKAHPNWVFKAIATGLDWDTVIKNETKLGLNLINKSKTNGWLSYENGAYDWSTDSFVPFDGSTWVTASKAAVEYYMDPRNFLFQNSIFQFEALEYQSDYQIKTGVEKILNYTPMLDASFTYVDETTLEEKTITYSQAFMDAAVASGVSPYHLASRVKQEVIRNSTTFSDSVTGTVAGYEGYYNFYNIGATHSTAAGGAIANGLNFAMGNKISTEANRIKYSLPWDNRYKAIVGGAKYIGTNYINRGQNTIYLQKFNMTATSTYTHQYMANVEAANSEAAKTYTAYNGMGLLDSVLVFNIPVYENMPATACPVPTTVSNPNNWLKALKLDSYDLTPAFKATYGGYDYALTIEDESVTELNLTATKASTKSSIKVVLQQNGTKTTISTSDSAKVPLVVGENKLIITVTAENGDTNKYNVTITKTK